MMPLDISKRIKEVMKERNLRQVDILKLAESFKHLGELRKGDLSLYVNGKVRPYGQNLHLLASVLNVSESWLMGLDAPKERVPEILALYSKLDKSRQMEVLEHIKFKLDEQEEAQGLKLVADPKWKAELTDKDRKIINLKAKQVMEGHGPDDLIKASMDGRESYKFNDDDPLLMEAAVIEALEDMALERKEKYTPKKHKVKKEGN